MNIIDCHTHDPMALHAVIAQDVDSFDPQPGRFYAVGLHPWRADALDLTAERLLTLASHPQVLAIGETGLDTLRGPALDVQMRLMHIHMQVAQALGKPVVAHMVRTTSQLFAVWRQYDNTVPAIVVHGVRGNENVVKTLVEAGCYVSFGPHFNARAARLVPHDRLLIETDDSGLDIDTVACAVAEALDLTPDALTRFAERNAARCFGTVAHQ